MRLASLWLALVGCAPIGPGPTGVPSAGRNVPSDSGKARIVDVYDRGSYAFALGDVDDDGALDIVAEAREDARGGADAGALLVYPGTLAGLVDGSAAKAHLLGALGDVRLGSGLALSDVDHDGVLDVLVLSGSDRLYVWKGPLAGTQDASAAWLRVDGVSAVVALGDVDGDGFADWALETEDHAARLVTSVPGPGRLHAEALGAELPHLPHPAGDVDGDGRADLLLGDVERADGSVIAWTSEDRGQLFPIGDLDEDGDVDAITGTYQGSELRFVPGPLTGDVAGLGTSISLGVDPLTLSEAGPFPDLDGDGHVEAMAFGAHALSSDVSVSERVQLEVIDGAVLARVEEVQASASQWAAGDLDGDGHPELVVGGEYIDGNPPRPTIGIY